jgi:hypothetical protein
MKRVSPTAQQDEPSTASPLNAVIVYDTFSLALKAKAQLEERRTAEKAQWNVKPWRAEKLKLPASAGAASKDAAEAHLIILAMPQARSFRPWLMDWLERWARCRKFEGAALAVCDGGDVATLSARTPPELSRFAKRHGLRLELDDNALTGVECSWYASELHDREVSVTPTLRHIMKRPEGGYPSHSGINE